MTLSVKLLQNPVKIMLYSARSAPLLSSRISFSQNSSNTRETNLKCKAYSTKYSTENLSLAVNFPGEKLECSHQPDTATKFPTSFDFGSRSRTSSGHMGKLDMRT